MNDILLLLAVAVVASAIPMLAVRAAREMDAVGRDGRIYGLLILVIFPVGLLLWLIDRRRPRTG